MFRDEEPYDRGYGVDTRNFAESNEVERRKIEILRRVTKEFAFHRNNFSINDIKRSMGAEKYKGLCRKTYIHTTTSGGDMTNTFTAKKLNEIKTDVESMEKYHQVEILRIMENSKTKLNENRAGVFVNLTFLEDDVLHKIVTYVNYVKEQTSSLNKVEKEKEQYKSTFFSGDSSAQQQPQKRIVNLF